MKHGIFCIFGLSFACFFMQGSNNNPMIVMKNIDHMYKEKEKNIEKTTTQLMEQLAHLAKNSIQNNIFIDGPRIFEVIVGAMEQKISFLNNEIKIRQELINPEIYAAHMAFFFEIRKKALKLQRLNNVMSNSRKVIVPLLWTTAVVNPPVTIGLILLYPLFYLATLPPTINQKFKNLKTECEYLMKKPKKNDNITVSEVNTILRKIQTDERHTDVFEVFSAEETDATKNADLKESYPKYELQKDILIDFDYEQALYDYYSAWFSRRMLYQLILITGSTSLAWLAAKKINPKITNKTYRSYNNWYETYKRKTIKSLLHGVTWLLKRIDQEEDINDLKRKKGPTL